MTLQETIEKIEPLDKKAMELSQNRWNSIAKPLHSLGLLEEVIIQIAGITGDANMHLEKKGLVTMCADNGVVAEGVTQSGQEVTAIVAENFLDKKATAAILCEAAGADIYPIDIGMAADTRVPNYKVAYGTKNLAAEPAMTREEAVKSLETGIAIAEDLIKKGYTLLATGEMGIGNTTTSSAVASVLLDQSVETMTGKGAGLSSAGLEKKIAAIKKGIELHNPNPEDAVDVLAKVGGFDIGGMAGVCLGCAANHVPVVIDGFISGVAALVAARICPQAIDYMIASHVSEEPATELVLKGLHKEAMLHAHMCLGEGTGAVTIFPFIDMANEVYSKMSTFTEISVEQYEELS